jgi:hypothetical protein
VLDLRLDRFHDDDRVVDDEADGEHEAEERQRVRRESHHREEHERADEGHRDGEDRDQRGTPVLEEHEHDEDHEPDRFEQRDDDLLRAFRDGDRRVERQGDVHVRRHLLRQTFHARLRAIGGVERVRPGDLVEADDRRRDAVPVRLLRVVLGAELEAGDVLQPYERAVGVRAHDDAAEFVGVHQTAARPHRVGELPTGRRRLAAERPRGVHDVLRRDRVHDVRHGQPHVRDRVRIDPDAHGVVRRAEDLHLPDPWHARELVLDVDDDVVREEVLVPRLVR